MGYVWLELTLIADLNGGVVTGTPEQIGESLAYVSLTKRPSLSAKCITNALGFMEKCGWIAVQTDRVLILNYLKYHTAETLKKIPTNERTNKQTNEQTPKPPRGAVVYDMGFENFWKIYPKHAGKKQAADQWKKEAAHSAELPPLIAAAIARQKEIRAARAQAKLFTPEWPDPVRYLKYHRWEDEIEMPEPAQQEETREEALERMNRIRVKAGLKPYEPKR